MLMLLK
jgi:hypothetical protein